ncbi:SWIM zinc finger family protein [Azospirillum sp. sgz301742]
MAEFNVESCSRTAATAMPPRFDIDALRELAGDQAFARGQAYHRDGHVELLAVDEDHVLSRVAGTELYRAELRGRGRSFTGACSCRAFSNWGFCKHLVATALAANEAPAGGSAEADYPIERIRRHLRTKDAEALVEMILAQAERDPALFQRLDLATATESADDETLFARLRTAITKATSTDDYFGYDAVPDWAADLDAVLDPIEDLIKAGRAALAVRLLDHFLERAEEAPNVVADSEGEAFTVIERAYDLHVAACRAASPDPVALARALFEREAESNWDVFGGGAVAYQDVLGEAGLAEFRRLAEAAWSKLKPASPNRRAFDETYGLRYRLTAILDDLAELDGDVDARIAIRAKDLSSPHRYVEIAQICLDHGRDAEALRWVEEGLWQFEDQQPDQGLTDLAAELYQRAGRTQDAEALLWARFARQPSLALYERLKEMAGGHGASADAARDRAVEMLRAGLGKGARASAWHSPADLLIQVLMKEKLFDAAWEAVKKHGASAGLHRELAGATEDSHPQHALTTYKGLVEGLVGQGGQPNYEEAFRLVTRMGAIRRRLGEEAKHAAYVADLKIRFKPKRNFMKLLAS